MLKMHVAFRAMPLGLRKKRRVKGSDSIPTNAALPTHARKQGVQLKKQAH
jgi:hypothetical protein